MRKKISILFFAILLGSVTYAQNCNIGNQTKTTAFGKDSSFGSDMMMGIKRSLSSQSTLRAINMIGNNTKGKFKMAVYSDNGGKPYKLMAKTNVGTVTDGVVSLPVPETLLPAGNYWIVAVYAVSTYHSDMNTNATGSTYFGYPLPFANEFPATISGASSYSGIDLLYFLSLDCGNTLAAESFEFSDEIAVYPNPSADIITISGITNSTNFSIINTTGSEVLKGSLDSSYSINIQSLASGIYFLRLSDGKNLRFVKK